MRDISTFVLRSWIARRESGQLSSTEASTEASAEASREGRAAVSTPPVLSGRRILVIDDDVEFGTSAVLVLVQSGAVARFHRGPFGCLQAIREMRTDIVLLDVSMPRMDGPQVVRIIREAFGVWQVRTLLCSNMEIRALERLGAVLKAHGVIPKIVFEQGNAPELIASMCSGSG